MWWLFGVALVPSFTRAYSRGLPRHSVVLQLEVFNEVIRTRLCSFSASLFPKTARGCYSLTVRFLICSSTEAPQ